MPLLDYLVKTVILDRGLGDHDRRPTRSCSTPAWARQRHLPLLATTAFRGLPSGALFGNFFRSVLSIPLADRSQRDRSAACSLEPGRRTSAGTLQKWAAVISKAASDTVAGFIEGLADRHRNIQTRLRDYKVKFDQLFDIYAQLELLYPEVQTFAVLRRDSAPTGRGSAEARDLEKIIMIHALDLLYFWMYQPRARTAMTRFVQTLSEDERHILASSQFTLQRHREISQMFIDGILGSDFPRPLSFYLGRYPEYLERIKTLVFGEEWLEPPAAGEGGPAPVTAALPECGAPRGDTARERKAS